MTGIYPDVSGPVDWTYGSSDSPADDGWCCGRDDDYADGSAFHEDRCDYSSVLDSAGKCGVGGCGASDGW